MEKYCPTNASHRNGVYALYGDVFATGRPPGVRVTTRGVVHHSTVRVDPGIAINPDHDVGRGGTLFCVGRAVATVPHFNSALPGLNRRDVAKYRE